MYFIYMKIKCLFVNNFVFKKLTTDLIILIIFYLFRFVHLYRFSKIEINKNQLP